MVFITYLFVCSIYLSQSVLIKYMAIAKRKITETPKPTIALNIILILPQ